MFPISTCIRPACSKPMCGCLGSFLLHWILFKNFKISGSFVRISHASKKCFNLPTSGKFGTILAENKLFTHGWTFLRLSKGIKGGKDMLNKVYFLFIFTMESTASSSSWVLVSVEYFLSRLSKYFLEEESRMFSSITPPQRFWRSIPKGILVCQALSCKYFDGLLFFIWVKLQGGR